MLVKHGLSPNSATVVWHNSPQNTAQRGAAATKCARLENCAGYEHTAVSRRAAPR